MQHFTWNLQHKNLRFSSNKCFWQKKMLDVVKLQKIEKSFNVKLKDSRSPSVFASSNFNKEHKGHYWSASRKHHQNEWTTKSWSEQHNNECFENQNHAINKVLNFCKTDSSWKSKSSKRKKISKLSVYIFVVRCSVSSIGWSGQQRSNCSFFSFMSKHVAQLMMKSHHMCKATGIKTRQIGEDDKMNKRFTSIRTTLNPNQVAMILIWKCLHCQRQVAMLPEQTCWFRQTTCCYESVKRCSCCSLIR